MAEREVGVGVWQEISSEHEAEFVAHLKLSAPAYAKMSLSAFRKQRQAPRTRSFIYRDPMFKILLSFNVQEKGPLQIHQCIPEGDFDPMETAIICEQKMIEECGVHKKESFMAIRGPLNEETYGVSGISFMSAVEKLPSLSNARNLDRGSVRYEFNAN